MESASISRHRDKAVVHLDTRNRFDVLRTASERVLARKIPDVLDAVFVLGSHRFLTSRFRGYIFPT